MQKGTKAIELGGGINKNGRWVLLRTTYHFTFLKSIDLCAKWVPIIERLMLMPPRMVEKGRHEIIFIQFA